MTDLVTIDLLKKVVPPNSKRMISQEVVDTINSLQEEEDFREAYRDNILGYVNVLQDGRFKVQDYMHAVRFLSYRLMDGSIVRSWAKTFPERYQGYVARGMEPKHIASVASMYAKGKLVTMLTEQSLTPFHIVNQDYRQEALLAQVNIMRDMGVSPKTRSEAANSVLTHTKGPDESKIEIDMHVSQDNSVIEELRRATRELTDATRGKIIDGEVTVLEAAEKRLSVED